MDRNIIITGGAGNLGQKVVEKFKREGYKIIATIAPESGDEIEEADDVYEVDVTDEKSVDEFRKEYVLQYGEVECLALLVGGYKGSPIENTTNKLLSEMIQLNFLSAFHMVKNFLPIMKKTKKGCFLMVGALPALQPDQGIHSLAYALSKGMLNHFSDLMAQEVTETSIRSHVFVPSIIDTPPNREAMAGQDFSKWVNPAEIAEAMHYAATNPSLRNMTFKIYGGV